MACPPSCSPVHHSLFRSPLHLDLASPPVCAFVLSLPNMKHTFGTSQVCRSSEPVFRQPDVLCTKSNVPDPPSQNMLFASPDRPKNSRSRCKRSLDARGSPPFARISRELLLARVIPKGQHPGTLWSTSAMPAGQHHIGQSTRDRADKLSDGPSSSLTWRARRPHTHRGPRSFSSE